jgi:hypothetical protein
VAYDESGRKINDVTYKEDFVMGLFIAKYDSYNNVISLSAYRNRFDITPEYRIRYDHQYDNLGRLESTTIRHSDREPPTK